MATVHVVERRGRRVEALIERATGLESVGWLGVSRAYRDGDGRVWIARLHEDDDGSVVNLDLMRPEDLAAAAASALGVWVRVLSAGPGRRVRLGGPWPRPLEIDMDRAALVLAATPTGGDNRRCSVH